MERHLVPAPPAVREVPDASADHVSVLAAGAVVEQSDRFGGSGRDQPAGATVAPGRDVARGAGNGSQVDLHGDRWLRGCGLGWGGVRAGVTLTPVSGPPGSDVTARVSCDVAPEFYVVALDEGAPPGTIVGSAGVEDGPGEWTYELQAGDRDLRITAVCGDDSGTVRFDVEHPAIFPGPTWTNIGEWRPERDNTTVVGTDCPAVQARVTFSGAGGTSETVTAATDDHDDWEAVIPYAIPAGPVTVVASCGDIVYGPIAFERRGPAAPVPTPTATTPAPVPGPDAPPATPVGGAPSYTG